MTIIPMSRCSGPCDQGRKLCPCPERCSAPEDDRLPGDGSLAWLGLSLLCASALVTIFAVLWVIA